MTEHKNLPKLIHVARIQIKNQGVNYLFLRQHGTEQFIWHQLPKALNVPEQNTGIGDISIEEAIYQARLKWKPDDFRTVLCGFRYTLPERDEHGYNAYFYQMAASYSSSNGIYFDEDVGNNCFVNFASQEALNIWKKIKQENRL